MYHLTVEKYRWSWSGDKWRVLLSVASHNPEDLEPHIEVAEELKRRNPMNIRYGIFID